MAERQARKRAVNLSVDSDLLDEARRLGINLSEASEDGVRTAVRSQQEKRWLEENGAAIRSMNTFIDKHGLLPSKLRYRPE